MGVDEAYLEIGLADWLFVLEVSLFSFIVFLIAKFGADHVAAQRVVISLTSLIYMIPQAVGAAATVRVGYALERKAKATGALFGRGVGGDGLVIGQCDGCVNFVTRTFGAYLYR